MAAYEPPQTPNLEVGYSSTGHERKRITPPSMMYTMLPAIVQNRIPTLPSLRFLSGFHGRATHVKSPSTTSDLSTPATPPPQYTSRPASSGGSVITCQSSVSSDTDELELRDDLSERPASSRSLPPPFSLSETETGINWKYANQGITLTTQAYQESHSLARDSNDASAILTRQLYMHGMAYFLRGIPPDLTQDELLSLQAAVPANILNIQNDPSAHALIPFSHQNELSRDRSAQSPSILHRITAAIVFQTFVLIQFLMPYIKMFIGHAYRWEREHKVTQRIANKSIITVNEVGRRSLQLSHTICQMNDGKVGQAINDLTYWWVSGLTGGLQQGISEGFGMIGTDGNQTGKGRVEKIE